MKPPPRGPEKTFADSAPQKVPKQFRATKSAPIFCLPRACCPCQPATRPQVIQVVAWLGPCAGEYALGLRPRPNTPGYPSGRETSAHLLLLGASGLLPLPNLLRGHIAKHSHFCRLLPARIFCYGKHESIVAWLLLDPQLNRKLFFCASMHSPLADLC